MCLSYKILVIDAKKTHQKDIYEKLKITHPFDISIAYNTPMAISLIHKNYYNLVLYAIDKNNTNDLEVIRENSIKNTGTIFSVVNSCAKELMECVNAILMSSHTTEFHKEQLTDDRLKTLFNHISYGIEMHNVVNYGDNKKYIIDKKSIKNGLNSGHITAWFQPKISLDNGRVIGAEALARWDHQEYGLILPSIFMDAIRHYKLQRDLLLKILDDVIDTYLMLQHSGYTIPISVNLPPPLLDDLDLPEVLYHRVNSRGIKTSQVTFEILEDEAISDSKNYHIGVNLLRLRGFKLAQDDFGRGYSSMYNLISTPFTEIKIDRSLVSNAVEDDVRRTVLISLVQLSKKLGLYVTAEGIETYADLDFLHNIGCDAAQGFLISAAISPEKFKKFLASKDSEVYLNLSLH